MINVGWLVLGNNGGFEAVGLAKNVCCWVCCC